MPEVATKVRTNIRDRVYAVSDLITKPIDTFFGSVEKLVSLQPVKAVTNLVEHAGDGAVSFINKQADITRRWLS